MSLCALRRPGVRGSAGLTMWVFKGGSDAPIYLIASHGDYTLGRNPGSAHGARSDIYIPAERDAGLSRNHAVLTVCGDGLRIRNLGRYGTRVDAQSLGEGEEMLVRHGTSATLLFGREVQRTVEEVPLVACVKKGHEGDIQPEADEVGARLVHRWSPACTHYILHDGADDAWAGRAASRPTIAASAFKNAVRARDFGRLLHPSDHGHPATPTVSGPSGISPARISPGVVQGGNRGHGNPRREQLGSREGRGEGGGAKRRRESEGPSPIGGDGKRRKEGHGTPGGAGVGVGMGVRVGVSPGPRGPVVLETGKGDGDADDVVLVHGHAQDLVPQKAGTEGVSEGRGGLGRGRGSAPLGEGWCRHKGGAAEVGAEAVTSSQERAMGEDGTEYGRVLRVRIDGPGTPGEPSRRVRHGPRAMGRQPNFKVFRKKGQLPGMAQIEPQLRMTTFCYHSGMEDVGA